MTINKLGTAVLSSLMFIGAMADGVTAANDVQEDCDLALRRELRQICTPHTTEDVLKTTWPGGTTLGAPCYAAADAYYAALMAVKSDSQVTSARANFCQYAGLGRTE